MRAAVLVAGLLAVLASWNPLHAQGISGPRGTEADRQTALRRITQACRADTERFCPALLRSAPIPRDQVICLRPYKVSLSRGCRSAVNAATR